MRALPGTYGKPVSSPTRYDPSGIATTDVGTDCCAVFDVEPGSGSICGGNTASVLSAPFFHNSASLAPASAITAVPLLVNACPYGSDSMPSCAGLCAFSYAARSIDVGVALCSTCAKVVVAHGFHA